MLAAVAGLHILAVPQEQVVLVAVELVELEAVLFLAQQIQAAAVAVQIMELLAEQAAQAS
jgi:hypothetical protein